MIPVCSVKGRQSSRVITISAVRGTNLYGDESSRPFGPTGSDPLQGTRSDMNWQDVSGKSAANVAHWQKISQFRARHPAIGAGKQTTLSLKQGYGFVREHGDDKVLVIWAGQQ